MDDGGVEAGDVGGGEGVGEGAVEDGEGPVRVGGVEECGDGGRGRGGGGVEGS